MEQLGGAGVVVLGIHKGGGMIFNKDGLVEPARQMIQDRDPTLSGQMFNTESHLMNEQ